MSEFLILKLEGDDPRDAKPTALVVYEGEDPKDALPQGYVGDGSYAIVNWTDRSEGRLELGPVEVNPISGPEEPEGSP